MNSMIVESEPEAKDDELECQKAQEVIGLLLQKPDECSDDVLENSDFTIDKDISDLSSSNVAVSIADSSPLNICQVSLTDAAGMILESGDIIHHSLDSASSIQLEDGSTALIQNFEAADESDSTDGATKFIDGQAVQLEDGTTAFIHAAPREGLQPVQLEDGTLAYLSQTGADLFNTEESTLDIEQLTQVSDTEIKELDLKVNDGAKKGNNNRSVHKTFQCDFPNCHRLYTTMHHLKVHARSHSGDRPFKCSIIGCGKAFATSYGLKSHTRVHTGESPYKCPDSTCGKAFKTSGDLQKHIRTHTGERPFKCNFPGCNRAFTTSNIRKVHIRTHTGERPYVCSVDGCGRAFASATNYKNHIRIHTGEKPYICTVPCCNKRFTEYSSLYKHHVVHTHSKPYSCNFCGKNYRQTSTLAMHKRTTHNVQEQGGMVVPTVEEQPSEFISQSEESCDVPADIVDAASEKECTQVLKKNSNSTSQNSRTFPTIVTLQSESSSQIVQEPVYAVRVEEDGSITSTIQQIVLVADSSQLAALQQQLARSSVLPAAEDELLDSRTTTGKRVLCSKPSQTEAEA